MSAALCCDGQRRSLQKQCRKFDCILKRSGLLSQSRIMSRKHSGDNIMARGRENVYELNLPAYMQQPVKKNMALSQYSRVRQTIPGTDGDKYGGGL